jgi:hypothetical protein
MKIQSPIFSGSIIQSANAYANLSGSFTGSFTGSFKGQIEVNTATFENLTVTRTITVGTLSTDRQRITGSVFISGSEQVQGSINVIDGGQFQVDGVNVLDTALAFAIALG